MLKFILFGLFLTVNSAFGNSTVQTDEISQNRILGGRNAEPTQFPYQANLRATNNIPICSAIIINNHWVLSAAHCTQRQFVIPANVKIVVGTIARTRGGIVHRVAAIVNHSRYNGLTLEYDICLIRTQTAIQFDNRYVRPVALPRADTTEQMQVPAVVSGWGNAIYPVRPGHPQAYPEILQYKQTITINRNECIRRHGPNSGRLIYPYSLCTTNPIQRGICQGDAGSPLVSNNNELIGIAVWFIPCGRGTPDVYVRVYPFLQWIRSIAR